MAEQQIAVNMYDFDTLLEKVIEESSYLNEYFHLNFIYHQLITGHGLEFDRVRQYMHGDDVRHIDWKIFARSKQVFTKAYREEKQFDIIIVIDVSDTMLLGTTEMTKNEYAAVLAGTLAFAATEANDQVALVMNSDKVSLVTDPESDYAKLVHFIADKENYGGKKSWAKISNSLIENYDERSIIFIVSDFIDTNPEKFLPELSARFAKVYGLMVRDPIDEELPKDIGAMYLKGTGGKTAQLANLEKAREEYAHLVKQEIARVKEQFHDHDQLFFKVNTKEKFGPAFIKAVGEEKVIVL